MPPRHNFSGKPKKGTMKFLLGNFLKLYKWRMLLVVVCLAFNAATNFSASIFIRNITDTLTSQTLTKVEMWQQVGILLSIMAGLYIVGIFASYTWNRVMAVTTQKYLNAMRIKMFNKKHF